MKINRVFLTMTISGLTLLSGELFGQEHYEMSKTEHQIVDSVQTARHEQQVKQEQNEADASRLSDARAAQKETKARAKETKAKAKETQRIDREASSAAREAKMALRAEKRAQKARKDADKQSRKADRAKNTSDKNTSDNN
ncbi:MAG: hypothetical protein WD824_15990 [Cyclobacteriaceae bacterium]